MKGVLLNVAAGALFSLINVVVGAYLSERLAMERELSHPCVLEKSHLFRK
jgi:hypothetical protein